MKYSEAIRLGAMLRPQGFGRMLSAAGAAGETCANGAALDAIGQLLGDYVNSGFQLYFPLAGEPWRACPECGEMGAARYTRTLGGNVAHLNDTHRWTRERIADWIATIESEHAESAISAEEQQDPAKREAVLCLA